MSQATASAHRAPGALDHRTEAAVGGSGGLPRRYSFADRERRTTSKPSCSSRGTSPRGFNAGPRPCAAAAVKAAGASAPIRTSIPSARRDAHAERRRAAPVRVEPVFHATHPRSTRMPSGDRAACPRPDYRRPAVATSQRPDAGRRAGEHEVAGLQFIQRRQLADDLGTDQIISLQRSARCLGWPFRSSQIAPRAGCRRRRRDGSRRAAPNGRTPLRRPTAGPLPLTAACQVASRQVVADRVTNTCASAPRPDVAPALADRDHQLDLVVQFAVRGGYGTGAPFAPPHPRASRRKRRLAGGSAPISRVRHA